MNPISTMQLRSISSLFQAKQSELKDLLGYWTVRNVKEDTNFDNAVTQIKQQMLLSPVTIGDPKISTHREVMETVQPNFQMMMGGQRRMNIVTVTFPFTGSAELFEYRGGGALAMHTIYLPQGNTIAIDLRLPELNKEAALNEANSEMRTTRELINMNNPEAENWSIRMDTIIQEMAEKRRKEILDFYS